MKKFLLHICCAPCASYVLEELNRWGFEVTAFFYNPNIYPAAEYKIRRDEIKKYCQENKIKFIEGEYNHESWLKNLRRDEALPRLAKESEGGERCKLCYRYRLNATAEYAVQNGYKYFDSTLSISPHKNYKKIKALGDELAQKYNLEFYGQDWKKSDGFKKTCELSHQHNFYRQNYCGCEYSML